MTCINLWDYEEPINELCEDIEVPAWINQDITPADVAAIVQGGCASGAYMPAVTYHEALTTMHEHGDDVLDYIQDTLGELPNTSAESWTGLAVAYLSTAVELWACDIEDELTSALDSPEDETDDH